MPSLTFEEWREALDVDESRNEADYFFAACPICGAEGYTLSVKAQRDFKDEEHRKARISCTACKGNALDVIDAIFRQAVTAGKRKSVRPDAFEEEDKPMIDDETTGVRCERCALGHVCKFREDYLGAVQAVSEAVLGSYTPAPGAYSAKKVVDLEMIEGITVDCKYFEQKRPAGRI